VSKEDDEDLTTIRQLRDRRTKHLLDGWSDLRAMARTDEDVATFERLTNEFQMLILADALLDNEPPTGEDD